MSSLTQQVEVIGKQIAQIEAHSMYDAGDNAEEVLEVLEAASETLNEYIETMDTELEDEDDEEESEDDEEEEEENSPGRPKED